VAGAEVAFGDGAPALTHPGARQFDVLLRWRVVEQPIGLVEQLDHPVEVGRERIAEGFSDGELRTRPGEYEPSSGRSRSRRPAARRPPQRVATEDGRSRRLRDGDHVVRVRVERLGTGGGVDVAAVAVAWPDRSSATTGNRSLTRACAFQTSLLPRSRG